MTDDTESGPFGRAARIYRAAGWQGTLPLGRTPGVKGPVPVGFTGHDGRYPDGGDIGVWLSGPEAGRNIGLRMPPGVIGLDIDAGYSKIENGREIVKHGERTLAELEAKWGPLPPTWVSSARPAPSGIRFYRVPEALDGRPINWPGEAGKFIEIIQPGHRYAVVWPSTNPDADGAEYEWRHDSGLGRVAGEVPPLDELPRLPDTWVRGLALDYDRAEKADIGSSAQGSWMAGLRPGEPCPVIATVRDRAMTELRADDGSRHETARDALRAIIAAGGSGHRGAREAGAAVADAFTAAVGERRAVDGGELQRLVSGAVKLAAAAHPSGPRQSCDHDPATALAVPEGFTVPMAQQQIGAMGMRTPTPASPSTVPVPTSVDALVTEVTALPADKRDDAVRRIAEELVLSGASEADVQRARSALTSREGLSAVKLGEWDAVAREAKRARKERARESLAAQAQWAARAEVAARREEGRLLPPPHAPIDVARELHGQLPAPARWWRGDFYLWTGTHYRLWRDEAVDHWLYQKTADAMFDPGDDKPPAPWRPDEVKVNKISHALSRGLLYRPSEDDPDDARNQVACANGIYDVPAGQLLPHDPGRFNLNSVPFNYDPAAQAPMWQWFLNDVLPADAQLLLQEWFGYVLSGRTDMEKILHMQGLPRSGKGTAAHVLESLIGGESAVASPSMPSLVGTFGEQPLIGKSLAVLSDINWAFRDITEAVEIVKKISGRDTRDVNRKNREIWHGRLDVRFMIMGNDLPKFTDASGALSHRMLHVQFPGTVMGREDTGLKDRLLTELPGILNWALAGLARLAANGRFTEPQSSSELAADVRRQQGPVQAFLDDACVRAVEEVPPVPIDELFPVYQAWARTADVKPLDRERFSGALTSAGLRVKRSMVNGVRTRRVHGLVPQLTPVEGRGDISEWVLLRNPQLRETATGGPLPEGFSPPA